MNVEKKSIEIISDILGIDESEIKQALHSPEYAFFKIPKKTGGLREIHAPQGLTKEVQDRINKSLLKKMYRNGLIHTSCFGSIPTKSIMDNVQAHLFTAPEYMFKIDLKDAFHCVDKEAVKEIFYDVFSLEIREYRKRYLKSLWFKSRSNQQDTEDESFGLEDLSKELSEIDDDPFGESTKKEDPFGIESTPPWDYWSRLEYYCHGKDDRRILYPKTFRNSILFPYKKVKNFRSMVSNVDYVSKVDDLLRSMSSIFAELTTYEGKLVQGCSTSPLLMALAVTKTNLLRRLSKHVLGYRDVPGSFPRQYTGQSVYVDDIALSFDSHYEKDAIFKKMLNGVREIEKSTMWKFNRRKINLYEVKKTQPLITGLRLVTQRKTKQELKQMSEEKIKGARWRLRAWQPWFYLGPTIPKTLQRKIRAVIYQASMSSEDIGLQNRARSYIGYIFNIYPVYEKIPLQMRKPIDRYLQKKNLFVHHEAVNKTNSFRKFKIKIYKLRIDAPKSSGD